MKKVLATLIVGASPLFAFAISDINGIFDFVGNILNRLIPIFVSLAVVWFIWEVFQYTIAGDEEKKKAAKTGMIWGIVGIFVMVSVWGLVAILQGTFGLSTSTAQLPNLPL